jgi:predicted Fe-Mo cluster-binding NifX family protein
MPVSIMHTEKRKETIMKVAVSAQGTTLDAAVDPRFGRCQQILIVDADTLEHEVVSNPNISASGGAGIQTAQMISKKGAQVLLTGHCGPNAFRTLQAAGVQVYIDVAGTIRTAIDQYKNNQLQAAVQPNVGGHFGDQVGRGQAAGRGRGLGRGRGQGRGGGV